MMCLRRFMYRALVVLATFAIVVLSRRASAQTTVAISGVVTRNVNTHPNAPINYWISRSDCLADDVFQFPLVITQGAGVQLEVWVGQASTDCTQQAARMTPYTCLQVFTGDATQGVQTISIRAQDIVRVENAIYGLNGQGAGTANDCTKTTGGTAADDITLYFLPITSNVMVTGTPATWTMTKVDLVGPPPPTGITLAAGSTFVKASWAPTDNADVTGYQFFCEPNPGDPTPDAGPVPNDAGTGAAGAGGASGAAGTPDAADDASDADNSGAGGSTGAAGASGAGGASTTGPQCGGPSLVPGTLPSDQVLRRFQCGSVSGNTSTSGVIDGLPMAQVAVAITSFDAVGNVGQLSDVACAAPMPVNGFNELYHQAGGTAGGGFCSVSRGFGQRASGGWIAISLAILATCMQRRRSRRLVELSVDFDMKSSQ